jgi:hypothetical protein
VYFCGLARVDKVLGSSNFGNMPPRYMPFWDSALGKKTLSQKNRENQKTRKLNSFPS